MALTDMHDTSCMTQITSKLQVVILLNSTLVVTVSHPHFSILFHTYKGYNPFESIRFLDLI